ncbi:ring-cleaving dioxygenase [Planococcus shenhongbingii]|uniref:Ring-cleaving dioxygenase n=1 Tax=Planococcus shenhongbingii TaxID=3058398 RepID=A0ABT8NFU4_9BACL|nr:MULTISPECIES: ring-cleaving dioxygenase [unclassified Planococcus (in: firmicutes)]MDN7246774.1 ring-cleaving dioxygenase [Planococcus sp. N017]WKA58868.1 ring-cleaving dioxygenase [Planococcus sp. N016]
MAKSSKGIHHITAIVGNPQENVDFYAGVLGLRLVKKTINFDDPGTYHLYFGNQTGEPGTIITFFPWDNAYKGRIGDGQVGVISYVVPAGALRFWEQRLSKFGVSFEKTERFGEQFLTFEDPHGLHLELVAREAGRPSAWSFGEISPNTAIKGFGGATLLTSYPEKTTELLEVGLGLKKIGEEDDLMRFHAPADLGNVIDVKLTSVGRGQMGVGTVHHIAWRAEDDEDQLDWKRHIENYGLQVTPVQDRNYFNAIYFREYGDLLFEIATDPPGFAIDEAPEALGEGLMLPKQYEHYRARLNDDLMPINVKELD